jgi:class 3 adenylate cyclase
LLPYQTAIDVMWEEASFGRALTRLASFARLVCLDPRGTGSSDPVPLGALPVAEDWMGDIGVALDAVGSTTAAVIAQGGLGLFALLYAATYPERTRALVLIDSFAPAGRQPGADIDWIERHWGTGALGWALAPSRQGDEAFRRWHGRFERAMYSPRTSGALMRWATANDLRSILPTVTVPTLVVQHQSSGFPLAGGEDLARSIPGAQLVVLPGGDIFPWGDTTVDALDAIEEFITGVPAAREPERALATVLFTDIVGSTEHAARLGDRKWTEVLSRHDELMSRELERYRGRKVNPTGDGMLATFDGPARAVRCAQAMCAGARSLGVEVRAGLHTGEIQIRGADISGIAVHIGQRVSALAGSGEVLVSRTITDLVAGSGLEFEDRGEYELKGIPGPWRLFALCV